MACPEPPNTLCFSSFLIERAVIHRGKGHGEISVVMQDAGPTDALFILIEGLVLQRYWANLQPSVQKCQPLVAVAYGRCTTCKGHSRGCNKKLDQSLPIRKMEELAPSRQWLPLEAQTRKITSNDYTTANN